MKKPTARQIAGMIDHTLLKPDATLGQINQLCREARENHFAAVCVNPFYISQVHTLLKGSGVKTCSVIGFPLGASRSPDKVTEACSVLSAGAQEVDMVINIGALKDRNDVIVMHDIAGVAGACHAHNVILKVILETGLLTQEEKERACRLCIEAKADFVKTSTGIGFGGATVADIKLMSDAVKAAGLGVKASGGVRTYADACAMIDAGATRIGTSGGVSILKEALAEK
ncbi:MAG: deoxyribose-phosphate aldolase [Kiritimatiellales bacterium]